jgi:hypothetical protein
LDLRGGSSTGSIESGLLHACSLLPKGMGSLTVSTSRIPQSHSSPRAASGLGDLVNNLTDPQLFVDARG